MFANSTNTSFTFAHLDRLLFGAKVRFLLLSKFDEKVLLPWQPESELQNTLILIDTISHALTMRWTTQRQKSIYCNKVQLRRVGQSHLNMEETSGVGKGGGSGSG